MDDFLKLPSSPECLLPDLHLPRWDKSSNRSFVSNASVLAELQAIMEPVELPAADIPTTMEPIELPTEKCYLLPQLVLIRCRNKQITTTKIRNPVLTKELEQV